MTAQARIHEYFADQIRDGAIRAGQQLPTEAQICGQFSVSRATVQNAMSRLALDGWIERFPGKGTFAKVPDGFRGLNIDVHNIQSFEEGAAVKGDSVTYRLISFGRVSAHEKAACRLGIEAGSSVFQLKRIRIVDGVCIGSEVRCFSPALEMKIDVVALDTAPVHQLIERHIGLKIGRIEAELRAATASREQAEQLGIAEGAPLLVRAHTIYSVGGEVILFGESAYVEPFEFKYTAQLGSPAI